MEAFTFPSTRETDTPRRVGVHYPKTSIKPQKKKRKCKKVFCLRNGASERPGVALLPSTSTWPIAAFMCVFHVCFLVCVFSFFPAGSRRSLRLYTLDVTSCRCRRPHLERRSDTRAMTPTNSGGLGERRSCKGHR